MTPLGGARSAWGGQLLAAELPAADADQVVGALMSGRAFPGGRAVSGVVAKGAPVGGAP